MFRKFARYLTDSSLSANELNLLHPADLTALLELAWENRLAVTNFNGAAIELGHPVNRSDQPAFGASSFGRTMFTNAFPALGALPPNPTPAEVIAFKVRNSQVPNNQAFKGLRGVLWDHLIYAYMVENTRAYDIFRNVARELLLGEKLGTPTSALVGTQLQSDTQRWLRATEELFFRESAPFFIPSITSRLRNDFPAVGRNAYQRLFGMELNHGGDDNKPYPFTRSEAANGDFVATFEELLREVWLGVEHFNNQIGQRPIDDAKIQDLTAKVRDMLMTRRQGGNLSREEFTLVATMSWFHLALDNGHPIVRDLRATAASADQRLFKIAQRVGLPAHGLSRSYFDAADALSRMLTLIEAGVFADIAEVPHLYTPQGGGGPDDDMKTIIRHWSIISGRDLKARRVSAN